MMTFWICGPVINTDEWFVNVNNITLFRFTYRYFYEYDNGGGLPMLELPPAPPPQLIFNNALKYY